MAERPVFTFRVTRPGVPPRPLEVPASSLDDAYARAHDAGWTVLEQLPDRRVPAPQGPKPLTKRDIQNAVFWGALRAMFAFLGLCILIFMVLALIVAVVMENTRW